MRLRLAVIGRALPRDPFAVFLLVAAAIFALYWALSAPRALVEVTQAAQRSLMEDYRMMSGRKPDAAARARLIEDYVADELLFREAVARGMHVTDRTTKQRLIDRVRFMIAGAPAEPGEDALIAHYAAHPELYRAEPRMSLRHVFFEAAPADAPALLARLRAGGEVASDDFWMGRDLPGYGEAMLRGMFGQPFLDRLATLPVGEWTGPLRSTRGWHFVRVADRAPARMLPYPQAREQVKQDYMAGQTRAAVAREVDRLKATTDVHIE